MLHYWLGVRLRWLRCVAAITLSKCRMVGRWKRRWKIKRLNRWLLSYRRVNKRKAENYVGFVHLARQDFAETLFL